MSAYNPFTNYSSPAKMVMNIYTFLQTMPPKLWQMKMIGLCIAYCCKSIDLEESSIPTPTFADQRFDRKRFNRSSAKSLISAVLGLKAHLES